MKCEARKKTIIPGINLYNWFCKKYILEAPSVISRDLIQLALNKIDKPAADVQWAHDQVYELFFDLGATDEQLDFTTIYAIGRNAVAKRKMEDELVDLSPLLDLILEQVPSVSNEGLVNEPLQAQVFNLAYDNFLGRMGDMSNQSPYFVHFLYKKHPIYIMRLCLKH